MNNQTLLTLLILPGVCFLTEVAAQEQDSELKSLTAETAKRIVDRTNAFRRKNDLPPVQPDRDLTKAANQFARYMADSGKYGHQADGRTPSERAKASGYDYCIVRENIAYRSGPRPAADALTDVFVEGWIDSPGHRENMLAEYVTQTGVAVAADGNGKIYAVQLFGRPKSEAFKVRITNKSSKQQILIVTGGDSSEDFEIPSGVIMTMTRCRPVTLSLNNKSSLKVATSQAVEIFTSAVGAAELRRTDESAE